MRDLIQEATADCHDQNEEHMGLMNMVEEQVVCPFKAKVIGEEVEVVEVGSPESGFGLDAVCRYLDPRRLVTTDRHGVRASEELFG